MRSKFKPASQLNAHDSNTAGKRRHAPLHSNAHHILNQSDAADAADAADALRITPHRGIYLLPNSFTLAALFSGFYAIVQAMNVQFESAAIAIFCSMILDGMDGRVARLTNTQSAFGEQFDSLADMVSFGVAPALVMYEWHLKSLGKWGWLAAFIYVAGAAIRLARFNTNLKVVDKRYFQGLPSPAAGALMAGFVWLAVHLSLPIALDDITFTWAAFGLTIYAGVTMVSNAPFWSGKSLALKKAPVWALGLVALIFVAISSNPPAVLFAFFVVYSASGYLLWAVRCFKYWRNPTVIKPSSPSSNTSNNYN